MNIDHPLNVETRSQDKPSIRGLHHKSRSSVATRCFYRSCQAGPGHTHVLQVRANSPDPFKHLLQSDGSCSPVCIGILLGQQRAAELVFLWPVKPFFFQSLGRRVKGTETDVLFAWLRLNVEMWQQRRVESARRSPPGWIPGRWSSGRLGNNAHGTVTFSYTASHSSRALVPAGSPSEPSIKQEWLHSVLSFVRHSPVVDDGVLKQW